MHPSWNVCSEAENGQDGVELAQRLKPDVVLLDYAMPRMNGRCLLPAARFPLRLPLSFSTVVHPRVVPWFVLGMV
jgi:CheY-like chemotaxis protein